MTNGPRLWVDRSRPPLGVRDRAWVLAVGVLRPAGLSLEAVDRDGAAVGLGVGVVACEHHAVLLLVLRLREGEGRSAIVGRRAGDTGVRPLVGVTGLEADGLVRDACLVRAQLRHDG